MKRNVVIRKDVTIKCVANNKITDVESFIDSVAKIIASKFKSDFNCVDYEIYDEDEKELNLYYEVDVDAIHIHNDATMYEPAEDEVEFYEEFYSLEKLLNNSFVGIKFFVKEDSDYRLVA